MTDVKWGTGFKDQYIDRLDQKWLVSAIGTVFFFIGAFILIFQAYQGEFTTNYVAGLIVFVVAMLTIGLILSTINQRIHSIEKYLGFYSIRHEVRHEVYCKHRRHWHCVVLHYFKIYE